MEVREEGLLFVCISFYKSVPTLGWELLRIRDLEECVFSDPDSDQQCCHPLPALCL